MKQPYRIGGSVPDARAELVYVANDREKHVPAARAAMQIGIGGGVASIVAAGAGFPFVGAGILAVAAAVGIWQWRRSPGMKGVLLAVEHGELTVVAGSDVKLTVRLVDLLDVSLDTKSIRKVMPGKDTAPAVQFISTSIGPELDVSRIVLKLADGREPIRLSEQFLAHMDVVEWVGKIRSFLRKQGWVPDDEREADQD